MGGGKKEEEGKADDFPGGDGLLLVFRWGTTEVGQLFFSVEFCKDQVRQTWGSRNLAFDWPRFDWRLEA